MLVELHFPLALLSKMTMASDIVRVMRRLPSFLPIIALFFMHSASAQKPVLAWSARFGANIHNITGSAVAADGSIYVVGQTKEIFGITGFHIFVGKLSADGIDNQCAMQVGSRAYSANDFPMAMAFDESDGTVFIAGSTQSDNFPRVPNLPARPDQDSGTFLLRVDPCKQSILFSTYLPNRTRPGALLVSRGAVYLGADGSLIRFKPDGSQVIAQTSLPGSTGAITADGDGNVYVTGSILSSVRPYFGFA